MWRRGQQKVEDASGIEESASAAERAIGATLLVTPGRCELVRAAFAAPLH